MARTAEQIAADDALTVAIQRATDAYFGAAPRLLTDYVVLTAEQGIDEEGDGETAIGWLIRDNEVPHYRIIGLLDMALTRHRQMAQPARDD